MHATTVHGLDAMRPTSTTSGSAPSSTSMSAAAAATGSFPPLEAAPHASPTHLNADVTSPGQGLRILANHHRQHNPNDPKLRANPVFKSRRSSLLGSVLKSRSKQDARSHTKPPPRSSTAGTPLPRKSGAPPHQPTSTLSTSSPETLLANADVHLSAHSHGELRHLHPSSRFPHSISRSAHGIPHTNEASPSEYNMDESPNPASIPSPVQLAEGSVSTCSSTHAKGGLTLASDTRPTSPPLLDTLFVSRPAIPSAAGNELPPPPHTDTTGSVSPDAVNPTEASMLQPQLSRLPEESFTASASSPSVATDSPARRSSVAVCPALLPLITRTDVSHGHIQPGAVQGQSHCAPIQQLDVDRAPAPSPSRQALAATVSEPNHSEQSAAPSLQAFPRSSSALVTSPQRFSSLGRRLATRLAVDADLENPFPLPRQAARDINDELESPTSREKLNSRADRRMSMLDFLAVEDSADASPRLAQASLSAEDLPLSMRGASPTRTSNFALVPPSMPLLHASRQLKLEAAAARSKTLQPRTIDLCSNVRVSVEPLVDRLTMFGSMQSSSNYSLAGTVVVEVPKLNVPCLSSAAALARDGSTTDDPSVHVEALTIRFTGYSVYVDATGRFNAIKLTEVSQELLQPQGYSCPVQLIETGDPSISDLQNELGSQRILKYETEFDLSIPGWLPSSQRSRFGATFYCVQATALVEGQVILSAVSGFEGPGSDASYGESTNLNLARSLESELSDLGGMEGSQRDGTRSPPSTSSRSKTKNTWLNKTAKQLQLRTLKKSTGAELEQSSLSPQSRRGFGPRDGPQLPFDEADPLFTKTTEACNQLLPSGQHSIKSESLSILIRRCRDVVPVPVARLARLATVSQIMRDAGATPSLSQSMAALAGLQEGADSGLPGLSAGLNGMHLPISASAPALAPMSLAALASASHSADPDTAQTVPSSIASDANDLTANATGSSQCPAALAPSPRIDELPRSWGTDAAAEDARREAAVVMPRVPSAFDAPQDPAKLAAAASALTPSATLPNLPTSTSRASSLLDPRFGNANSPPRTSSRAVPTSRSSAPLRHFVHRPTLHLPPELGITPDKAAGGGLNFSLTLSLPSHVHVTGPKSDVLSFGVQIEVGRTEGWEALKKWGGLRLKDMELVCLQTERHSSMPSRSFCAAFPVPPMPNNVDAADLPVVTRVRRTPSGSNGSSDAQRAAEERFRQGYDRSLVLGHIALANQGKAPHPAENNVERVRTTIVGPPPFTLQNHGKESGNDERNSSRKGKTRVGGDATERSNGLSSSPSRGSPAGSGTNTPDGASQSAGLSSSLRAAFAPAAQISAGSRASVMQPLPRALTRSHNSSSSSLRQASQRADGASSLHPRPGSAGGTGQPSDSSSSGPAGRSRRPIPLDFSASAASETTRSSPPLNGPASNTAEPADLSAAVATAMASQDGAHATRSASRTQAESPSLVASELGTQRRNPTGSQATRADVTSTVSTRTGARSAVAPRRSRFETAMSRLSTFASSMLEQPNEASAAGLSAENRGVTSATASASTTTAATGAAASLRATYAFSGDDAQGVDLTKGRVRMTINLPLVSSDTDKARKGGSAQLIPDFESPYVRVRHKLKVKLGFGLKSNVASGQDGQDWAQALVMCVPVRFTEAPPKEVQDQFGPVTVRASTEDSSETASRSGTTRATASRTNAAGVEESLEARLHPDAGLPVPFAEPLLPAYAQLFREDGSRLADEGEDLPRYPGRMSVVGEIDEEDPASGTPAYGGEGDTAIIDPLQDASALATVQEDRMSEAEHGSYTPDAPLNVVGNPFEHVPTTGLPGIGLSTPPRFSSLRSLPTPMDRTASLPGARLLTRTTSSGLHGLRHAASSLAVSGSSQSATASPAAEQSNMAGGRSRAGSSAFDPLPIRPGMRRRSATTASLVSFSRIMPAEVLDEALVTSALDDEEDRMDGLQASDTLNSLDGTRMQGDLEIMHGIGQDEDMEDDEDNVEGLADGGEDDEELDGNGSLETDSEAGHAAVDRHLAQLSESEHEHAEIGRAF
ncbi:hypothetical protein EX895_002345 [Sporisorium graminicola]|uniref:Uncharacterized protein n=1 Tax=Sporisorium graminicola TaxID=280036 RepID=A0A4U7KVK9_9BASI|nr:hypothetical protein EX895_002345 [Sporisorium graminicola]TKY88714.1 hypothetical protein EX895_002345 [Sporisorium graminicola]